MWILTDGVDYGISQLMGDSVHREMIRRRNLAINPHIFQHNLFQEERLPRLNVFGVTKRSSVIYKENLTGQVLFSIFRTDHFLA